MTFAQSIATCFSKYATFSGRASRSEFWWFYLFTIILSVIFTIIEESAEPVLILYWIVQLGLTLPTLAVSARRLHDTNRSGWWILLPFVGFGVLIMFLYPDYSGADSFIQMVGMMLVFEMVSEMVFIFSGIWIFAWWIVLLIFMALKSSPGENRYGPQP